MTITIRPSTSASALLGYLDVQGNYHETEFYQAYFYGDTVYLEGIDTAANDVLLTVIEAMTGNYLKFPCGLVEKHSKFDVRLT